MAALLLLLVSPPLLLLLLPLLHSLGVSSTMLVMSIAPRFGADRRLILN